MAKRPSFVLNFRFVGNAQSGTVSRTSGNQVRGAKGRFAKMEDFARIMVDDVALNTAARTYETAKASLVTSVKMEVAREISRMAKMIAKFLVQPNGSRGPKGTITSAQQTIAQQSRSIWGNKNILYYDLGSSDAYWSPRNKRYMKWKSQHSLPSDWYLLSGSLRKKLSNESLYQDLGPVQVSFIKGPALAGATKQTTSGRSGKVSATYQVGRLEVAVFGRITPSMLPSLMDTLTGGVNDVTPHGSTFIPSLFRDKEVSTKLRAFKDGTYRPVLEPFLSYYLTRAIPNAVFNRTEKLINDQGMRFARNAGKREATGGEFSLSR